LFLSERTARTKIEKPEKKHVQCQAQIGIQLRERTQGLTLLLMLWCAYKLRHSLAALQKIQKAAESDADIYTIPMDRNW
jgi:hypothetical protein